MKIIVNIENNKSKDFIIDKDQVTIGRGKSCHVCIPSDHISREHLQVTEKDGAILIKDLTLSNWVFYNDEKLVKNHETQYFDFAPLVLPGNISIKIELNHSSEIDEKKVSEKITDNKTIRATSSRKIKLEQEDKVDIYSTRIEKTKDSGAQNKKSKTKKGDLDSKQAIILMIGIFAIIGGYFVYDIMFANNEPVETVTLRKRATKTKISKSSKTKSKRLKTKKQVPKANSAKVTKSKNEIDFDGLIQTKDKCIGSFVSDLCKVVLEKKSGFEGIMTKGNTLYVFKDKRHRVSRMFLRTTKLLNRARKHNQIDNVIAGEFITLPATLKKIESQKISKVKIFVFSQNSGRLKLISSYSLDPSLYRRYSARDYELAYQNIYEKMDLKYFEKKFTKIVKKD